MDWRELLRIVIMPYQLHKQIRIFAVERESDIGSLFKVAF